MFKQNFIKFCNLKEESPSFVCRQVGLAPATFSCWTDDSIPRKATLLRIADYFGITVEELLRSDEEKGSAPAEPSPSLPPLAPEFYELLNQMTLQELAELKAHMEEKIKNRR